MRMFAVLGVVALLGTSAVGTTDSQGFVRIAPEDVKFETGADGIGRAVIEGDPTKAGIYVLRVRFRPGVMSRPHFHREDRLVVVLKGTWWTGTGDVFAPDKTIGLKPGSFMKHPAGGHHFDGAKNEEVILQIVGYGPSTTTELSAQR